jgi:glycosyltransferase involved in cell wall biosynthesis
MLLPFSEGNSLNISALIPTYNRRVQVLRAIQSVLAQTLPVDEIIVVDDGSTDGTAEAIRAHYGQAVRVVGQENAGVSAARNRAIREARGNWLAFLDSDDEWLPSKIQRQIEALETLGNEVGLCFTDCTFESGTEKLSSAFEGAGFVSPHPFGIFENPAEGLVGSGSPLRMQSTLVLKSLLDEINGFDERLMLNEDYDAFFRLSFKTKFCFVSEPLVRVDRNPDRAGGLCQLFESRDNRKYDDLRRIFNKWLSMPEIDGSDYEDSIRDKLRLLCYESAENSIRGFRVRAVLRELACLRALREGYTSIVFNLISRKVRKLSRDIRTSVRAATHSGVRQH